MKINVPPIKIQGIKTKLVPFIKENVKLDEDMVWVEPFMGSGVVGFNICHPKSVFADTNPYIISFYNAIKTRKITARIVREYLEEEGMLLKNKDDDYYYEVRERFNKQKHPLDFLFLNRAGFNGMVRFNRQGNYNVPYGHKPERFSKSYITKIVNQIAYVEECLLYYDWTFVCQSFDKTIRECDVNCFLYCDPPYIGRNVDYYDTWDELKEKSLKSELLKKGSMFMISTWDHNQYRDNEYLRLVWNSYRKVTVEHFYFLGGKENNRNSIIEALVMNY